MMKMTCFIAIACLSLLSACAFAQSSAPALTAPITAPVAAPVVAASSATSAALFAAPVAQPPVPYADAVATQAVSPQGNGNPPDALSAQIKRVTAIGVIQTASVSPVAESAATVAMNPSSKPVQAGAARSMPPGDGLNDDGSALTPPDLSAYLELNAMQQQLQRDQLALQIEQAEQEAAQEAAQKTTRRPAPPRKQLAQSKEKPSIELTEKSASGSGPAYLINLAGVGDDLQARVMVPGYGPVTVHAGQTLPNGWRIETIDDDGVSYRASPGRPEQRLLYQTQNG